MIRLKVAETIEKHNLIEAGDRVVLGLSGGPDSVCLFHILLSMASKRGFSLYPVHINHGFRPGAAEEDQAYVNRLCESLGVICRNFNIDCPAMAAELGMTGEEAGRKARYDAFFSTAEELSDSFSPQKIKIAVAHNANDQAETVLFRILRGTGTDGLAGMAYKRKERGFDVIRPLMDVFRDEIEEYCERESLNPARDHTNEEPIYARNRIRLELIPYLAREYNENITEALLRISRIAGADREFLGECAGRAFAETLLSEGEEMVFDRSRLAELPEALRHRVIVRGFGAIGLEKDISEERLAAADGIICVKQSPKTAEFPHGFRLTVAKGKVVLHRQNRKSI